jgi:uncharacterized protein (TIGR01319 family)
LRSVLCVDFGSTFTKAVLIDAEGTADDILLASASVPTTIDTDVLDGYWSICETIAGQGFPPADEVLACSSAGGGLRLAVVGYERSVTAEAGHRVGLSAGAKIVHVAAGPMTMAQVAALRATRPDVILLVGGTDGGNAEVVLHNGSRLAKARLGAPVVVAGNIEARAGVALALESTGRRFILTDNVLPQIGVINPDGARAAIRQMFLRHVIGGKHLSKGPRFASMVRAATPDAMLRGVEALAAAPDGDGGDVLVFDIGGATTDVYSVVSPEGEDATLRKEVVAPLWHARTVEGDLGMRWNARGVVEAARVEHLLFPGDRADGADIESLQTWAARVEADPACLPKGDGEVRLDLALARVAALTAVRRHARPSRPGDPARPLARLAHVIGSGGVLRHSPETLRDGVLRAVITDVGGGWKVPTQARTTVDSAYLLFAAGLLADADGYGIEVAARVAGRVLASEALHP